MKTRVAKLGFSLVMAVILSAALACDRYEILLQDLTQRDANEILVLLRDEQIDAKKTAQSTKKSVTYHIEVSEHQAKEALRLLVHNQVPKIHRAGLKEVFPPGASGIIPSKSDELARMTMAMQGEIEALLKAVPGIADARVVISCDSPLDYQRATSKKTASVAIISYLSPDLGEAPLSDGEIKGLVATSVSGLAKEDVTVVQKMIEQVMLSSRGKTLALENPSAARSDFMFSPWLLLALTLFALAIAAYAIIRLALDRRVLNKASLPNG
ncbi:MAG TPA: hypothetical protein VEL47_03865 [Myxococcota bacterium]|nr:hypothetical protein [Myxococcota bacterium]